MAPGFAWRGQRGSALAVSLVFMLLLTLMALAGIRASTSQERMAANVKLKNDSFQAAESGMRYVEAQVRNDVLILPASACVQAECNLPISVFDPDHLGAPGAGWRQLPDAVAGNDMVAWFRLVRLGDSEIPANVAVSTPSTLYRVSVVSYKGSTRTVLESIYAFTRI